MQGNASTLTITSHQICTCFYKTTLPQAVLKLGHAVHVMDVFLVLVALAVLAVFVVEMLLNKEAPWQCFSCCDVAPRRLYRLLWGTMRNHLQVMVSRVCVRRRPSTAAAATICEVVSCSSTTVTPTSLRASY